MSELVDFTASAPLGTPGKAGLSEADASLVQSNIDGLLEGRELLQRLSDAQYTANSEPAFVSTIGAHFRHILEHYQCFIGQLAKRELCYDERPRCLELEQERAQALNEIDLLINRLRGLNAVDFARECQVCDQQTSAPMQTTLARELLFLQSHTVHHYAMVGAIARLMGVSTREDFGVAIATRAFNQQQSAKPEVEG